MSQRQTRRHFLQDAAASSAGLAAGLCSTSFVGRALAIEPVARNDKPKYKLSLAAYSYRDLLTGGSPALTLDDFIAECARMQLDGTELTSYYFPTEVTDDYLRHLKQLSFRLGLDVSGTAVGNDFCHPTGPERDKQIAGVKSWIDHADVLGAPVIRIFSGGQRDGQSESEARQLAVEGIAQCCEYAGQHGVFLALENHGGLTATPEGLLSLVQAVDSPWFGVNLDTGNFHGADIYAELAQLAPYALNVQVKVMVQPAGQERQATDFARLRSLLDNAKYRGYIVLEFEEAEDPRDACPRYVEELRKAFA